MRTTALLILSSMLLATPAAAQEAQAEADLSPETAAEITRLEAELEGAEGRSAAFGALTIGGTTLLVGGVVAMVVVAAIDPMGCVGMMDCVKPVEDFAAGISLMAVGAAAILVGGLLWGSADADARELRGRIRTLRTFEPAVEFGPQGFRLGLTHRF